MFLMFNCYVLQFLYVRERKTRIYRTSRQPEIDRSLDAARSVLVALMGGSKSPRMTTHFAFYLHDFFAPLRLEN